MSPIIRIAAVTCDAREAQQQTMKALAGFLPSPDAGPIVDRTDLAGKYDFTLEFTRDLPGAAPDKRSDAPPAPDLSLLYSSNSGCSWCARRFRWMW